MSADEIGGHFLPFFEVVLLQVVPEEGVGLNSRLLRGASSCHYY